MEKKFFCGNRSRLMDLLPEGSAAILSSGYTINRSADENYDFTVNNNFYYLTGIRQAEVHLILIKDKQPVQKLFIDEYDEFYAKWIGHKLTKKEASSICGIPQKDIFYKKDYEEQLSEILKTCRAVYLDLEKANNINYNSFGLSLNEKIKDIVKVEDVYPLVVGLRSAKQRAEIELFRDAVRVTKSGIEALMSSSKPGMTEYQLEACFNYAIKVDGNREFSFKTIAASGINATTLHYSENNSIMADGDMILFDLGAKSGGYCADISRTFPINGKFTELQRTVYNIVLAANKKIASVARAGMTFMELQKICIDCLTKGCLKAGLIKEPEEIKKYYFHSVSHSIGLDTHDPIDRKAPLPVGAVISDEPGLYFPELKIGVRIEDDLLLLKSKAVNLSEDIIKEPDEIEAFMAKNR